MEIAGVGLMGLGGATIALQSPALTVAAMIVALALGAVAWWRLGR